MANSFPQTDAEWLAICRARIDDAEANLHDLEAATDRVTQIAAEAKAAELKLDAIIRTNVTLPLEALQTKRFLAASRTKIAAALDEIAEWRENWLAERDAARDSLVYWTRAGLRVAQ